MGNHSLRYRDLNPEDRRRDGKLAALTLLLCAAIAGPVLVWLQPPSVEIAPAPRGDVHAYPIEPLPVDRATLAAIRAEAFRAGYNAKAEEGCTPALSLPVGVGK